MRSTRARSALLVAAVAGLFAVGVAAALAGSTSGAKIKPGGTLTIGLAEDPDALDPTLARTFVGRIVFMHLCEKLYDLNAKLQIVPQLAASLPKISKDKLTYTIALRKGLVFNDGTPVTAEALKASLDRHRTLTGSARASEVSPIASVDVSGPLTVTIHLKTPYSPLTAQLADRAGMIMSPKQLDALGARFASNPVCVGPFTFKDRVAGDHITLTKSTYYYNKAKVALSQITFRIITDPSARAQNLRSGDIQVADRLAATDVPTVQKDTNIVLLKQATLGYQGLTINVGNKNGLLKPYSNVGTPLAAHQNLRTAFDLALDRNTINRVVFNGLNQPDCYPISPVSPWRVTTKGLQCSLKANTQLAQQLVKSTGVPTPITVHLMIGTDPVAARLGQVIQSMEKEVGFNVVLEPTEFVTSLNRADAGKYDVFAIGWSGRVDPDGNIFQFVHTTGSQNDAGFTDAKLDYTLNSARRSTSEKSRITIYSAAMKIIHRQRPLIYLWHPIQYDGVRKNVEGVQMFGDGLIRAVTAGYTG
jgi:peptide/nickel transport system substrate-binding protein